MNGKKSYKKDYEAKSLENVHERRGSIRGHFDDAVYRSIKVYCVKHSMRISDFLQIAVVEYLKKKNEFFDVKKDNLE